MTHKFTTKPAIRFRC